MFISQNLSMGQINAIVKKLGGEERALRFLRGELKLTEANPPPFPIWKSVRLGRFKTPTGYRDALVSKKRHIDHWADDILPRIPCSQTEVEINLVLLSVGALGLPDNTIYSDLCAKAAELGLGLCPAEVGPALRLDYADQPDGEWIQIAMLPVTDSDDEHCFFGLAITRDGLSLVGDHTHNIWPLRIDHQFVFACVK